MCKVKNRRLTLNDKVGIFTLEGELVALGKVVDLHNAVRVVKIVRRYNIVSKGDRVRILTEGEANNPRRHFRVKAHFKRQYVAGKLGFQSMGVGDGLSAVDLLGQFHYKWREGIYFLISGSYLSGSGQASIKLIDNVQTSLNITVYGLSGGLLLGYQPFESLFFRGALEGGIGLSSVSLGDSGDEDVILNNRLVDGIIPLFRGEFSVAYDWKIITPVLGVNWLVLHKSSNVGLSLGLVMAI